jgi:MFS family permease
MVFAVLPLFITVGLGAPAFAVGVIEGVGDGSSAVVKLFSGWYSDRIAWRKQLAVGGYGGTVVGLGLLVAVTAWPQIIVARSLAWMGRGLRQPIRSAMLAASLEKKEFSRLRCCRARCVWWHSPSSRAIRGAGGRSPCLCVSLCLRTSGA